MDEIEIRVKLTPVHELDQGQVDARVNFEHQGEKHDMQILNWYGNSTYQEEIVCECGFSSRAFEDKYSSSVHEWGSVEVNNLHKQVYEAVYFIKGFLSL